MSQRTALLASLLLTVLVGVAIVSSRDRLLEAGQDPAPKSAETQQSADDDLSTTSALTQTGQRVVEVTLPADVSSSLDSTRASRNDELRGDDHDDDDDHDDHDDGDHDDDDHDDDDHDDDDEDHDDDD